MNQWLLLGIAIVAEAAGSLCLKAATTEPLWFVAVTLAYAVAFSVFTRVLRSGMPLGVAYGIWAASGVVLSAIGARLVFGEDITPTMIAGMVIIVAGVLCVELGTPRPQADDGGAS